MWFLVGCQVVEWELSAECRGRVEEGVVRNLLFFPLRIPSDEQGVFNWISEIVCLYAWGIGECVGLEVFCINPANFNKYLLWTFFPIHYSFIQHTHVQLNSFQIGWVLFCIHLYIKTIDVGKQPFPGTAARTSSAESETKTQKVISCREVRTAGIAPINAKRLSRSLVFRHELFVVCAAPWIRIGMRHGKMKER